MDFSNLEKFKIDQSGKLMLKKNHPFGEVVMFLANDLVT